MDSHLSFFRSYFLVAITSCTQVLSTTISNPFKPTLLFSLYRYSVDYVPTTSCDSNLQFFDESLNWFSECLVTWFLKIPALNTSIKHSSLPSPILSLYFNGQRNHMDPFTFPSLVFHSIFVSLPTECPSYSFSAVGRLDPEPLPL